MIERAAEIAGTRVPTFLYGTAWKEAATRGLVEAALRAGFRGIDTANQRKHYFEAAVGEAIEASGVPRADVFLQTKFTFLAGQDHRLPYDLSASIGEQVAQSFASSLEHLGVATIDSYVLHGPSQSTGLGEDDRAAWRSMESLHGEGKARLLGISNVSASQLEELVALAIVKPTFVQNRCYAERAWDHSVRAVCARHGIVYQGFSLLTANRRVLESPSVRGIAARHERTCAQVVFRFALELGMLPLTGTSDPEHMVRDLEVYDFALEREELETIARAGGA